MINRWKGAQALTRWPGYPNWWAAGRWEICLNEDGQYSGGWHLKWSLGFQKCTHMRKQRCMLTNMRTKRQINTHLLSLPVVRVEPYSPTALLLSSTSTGSQILHGPGVSSSKAANEFQTPSAATEADATKYIVITRMLLGDKGKQVLHPEKQLSWCISWEAVWGFEKLKKTHIFNVASKS